jgi:hypothetical protein
MEWKRKSGKEKGKVLFLNSMPAPADNNRLAVTPFRKSAGFMFAVL